LSFCKLIGIGTDGAASMIGAENSQIQKKIDNVNRVFGAHAQNKSECVKFRKEGYIILKYINYMISEIWLNT
jgi:hypothetical protein